ncbi:MULTISPECIES: thiamine pyrophosphate-requiring protein [unclassified Microbacterium]|uniref:thiamine pyrophosphate-requiring protein n=1 Tax=unclassified Microbacterium TaxID=2609290 RepID=UPI00214B3EE4|nr:MULTISPECIES: thiamine pyrophosphate-requiring protein [unclassified Microbacterium]MCR2809103.1 thiamine pyrophosphate-requiring protein [Microbacterium sp. zg.B185]WIM20256.1 thiamine pyrophosphate-requiring protein [Microbacterium sp. zg-B185]
MSNVIVDRLREWGVSRVYGYSGDGINGVLEAIRQSGGQVQFVQARHEENAAFMAVGEAKYAGGVGVVVSTQGPGAVHLLNGLYDAKLDRVPVVALIGQQHRSVLGSGYMQEIDLRTLFSDVAAQYTVEVSSAEQVPMVIDRAFRAALGSRSPAVVILPHDVQSEPAPERPHEHGIVPSEVTFDEPRVRAAADRVAAAADLLSSAQRPAFLIGQGAGGAVEEVQALAEHLGAAVVSSLLGKPFVDERLPFAAGTMGHLGTTASAQVFAECDALLIVGSNDPWTEFYPAPGQARTVQIDIDPRMIGNRSPVDVGLVGDAASTLRALREATPAVSNGTAWTDRVHEVVRRWRAISAERAAVEADPLNPEAVMRALNDHLPDNARVAVDVGSVVYWYARQLVLPRGVPAHVSGTLASMGCGIPYGIAAKLTAPDRPVLVLSGDGGMQMSGLAELVTVSSRWREWADPRFVIAVFDNGDLAEVSWEQREMEGAPRFDASQDLPSVPYDEYARLLGLAGERVSSRDDVDDAWRRAWAADRPCVLSIRSDPATPMLPPLAAASEKLDQMRSSLRAEEDLGGRHAARARLLLERYIEIEKLGGGTEIPDHT